MKIGEDIRYLLGAGVGIAVLAWLLIYNGAVKNLSDTAVGTYGGFIHDLMPASGGIGGLGGGNPSMSTPTMLA